ncbi:IS110 family transposase [Micrococcus luteus]|uniref:IS110 family transposase n=1 Tax=Micrococcus luteus TaxID=1270 RepID=UPI0030B97C36
MPGPPGNRTTHTTTGPTKRGQPKGCEGIGRHVAHRLLPLGEQVVDVPAKLSARMRVFATGQGRKTDDTDAHSIALAGVRMQGLHDVVHDGQLELLRLLVDRRRRIGEDHTRMVCQLHALLLELVPGGAKRDLSAAQARAILATVWPRDAVGKARKRVAMELVIDLERLYQRKKAANKELTDLVKATGTGLLGLRGIGPSGAARLLVEVGDITRFPTKGHFASWTGTAPIDVSSGEHTHHRLSRGGNRQINRVLHIMAIVQLRNPASEGRAYYDRKIAAGKAPNSALRCLKRRLSDIVYRTLLNDLVSVGNAPAPTPEEPIAERAGDNQPDGTTAGPGGHRGASLTSSATGSQPHTGTSEKSLPGPADTQPRTPSETAA